jgi:GST-like protein
VSKPVLFSVKGYGSAIVEGVLALAGVEFENRRVEESQVGRKSDILLKYNPLGQIPTMLLANGQVMTESAAICLLFGEGHSDLVPPPSAPERAEFLRWLIFMVAAVYPTFTYGDDPSQWVQTPEAQKNLKDSTNQHREKMWLYIESQIKPSPWFLGSRFSVLDIYVAVMVHWRPREEWFEKNCSKLFSIFKNCLAQPKLGQVLRENFS